MIYEFKDLNLMYISFSVYENRRHCDKYYASYYGDNYILSLERMYTISCCFHRRISTKFLGG